MRQNDCSQTPAIKVLTSNLNYQAGCTTPSLAVYSVSGVWSSAEKKFFDLGGLKIENIL